MTKTVSVMILALLSCTLFLAHDTHLVKASGTVYIRADGSVDPLTAPISTIDYVTYTLTGNITSEADAGIIVEKDNIVIDGSGFKVEGAGLSWSYGIYLDGRSNVTIQNTNIRQFGNGIRLGSDSNSNSVNGNIITNNRNYGVGLFFSSSNSVKGNTITNNPTGIDLGSLADHNSISGNTIRNNNYGIHLDSSPNNNISGNIITNNLIGIRLAVSSNNEIGGNNITSNDFGINLDYSSSNSLIWNSITNNTCGVHLSGSSTNDISENKVTENKYEGIWVVDSSKNNTIRKNNVSAIGTPTLPFNEAVWLQYNSDYNNITENTLTDSRNGLHLHNSSYNYIGGNKMTNNNAGIWLRESSNYNVMAGNNITDNHSFGICLGELNLEVNGPQRNVISRNNISDNGDGIYLCLYTNYSYVYQNNIGANDVGVEITSISSNNTFFHNNFVANSQFWISSTSVNVWDDGYPSGGNYWSDHNPVDENNDKIGDTPYAMDENNTDKYPLIFPFECYENTYVCSPDLNKDGKVNIVDVTKVATAFGSTPGDSNWSPTADLDLNEVINIIDVSKVAKEFGNEWVS